MYNCVCLQLFFFFPFVVLASNRHFDPFCGMGSPHTGRALIRCLWCVLCAWGNSPMRLLHFNGPSYRGFLVFLGVSFVPGVNCTASFPLYIVMFLLTVGVIILGGHYVLFFCLRLRNSGIRFWEIFVSQAVVTAFIVGVLY